MNMNFNSVLLFCLFFLLYLLGYIIGRKTKNKEMISNEYLFGKSKKIPMPDVKPPKVSKQSFLICCDMLFNCEYTIDDIYKTWQSEIGNVFYFGAQYGAKRVIGVKKSVTGNRVIIDTDEASLSNAKVYYPGEKYGIMPFQGVIRQNTEGAKMDEIISNIIESLKTITADTKEISKKDPETALKWISQTVYIIDSINSVSDSRNNWGTSILESVYDELKQRDSVLEDK